MAVLALIQSYPYDEVLGGDAAYILSLANYLVESGYEVHGLLTDTSRGRANPIYRSSYAVERLNSWSVRGAFRLSRRVFFAPHLSHVPRILGKLSSSKFLTKVLTPPSAEKWAQREATWLRKKLEIVKPDALILVHEAIHFAPFLDGLGVKVALLGHVPAAQKLLGPREPAGEAESLRYSRQFKEKLSAALAHADCVGMNNREDMAYLKTELGLSRSVFVGMGYASVQVLPDSEQPGVLFVGNATEPNMAALSWFVSRIWPRILASCPAARFRVVGRAALAMDNSPGPQIDRVGPVIDITAEYERSQVVVVPLTSGTAGVKIKAAEAMAYGRPLVTTSFGVDASDKHQFDDGAILADTAEDFAGAVIALLSDPDLRRLKGLGAQKVFAEQFSYEACYGEFNRLLQQISQRNACQPQNNSSAKN